MAIKVSTTGFANAHGSDPKDLEKGAVGNPAGTGGWQFTFQVRQVQGHLGVQVGLGQGRRLLPQHCGRGQAADAQPLPHPGRRAGGSGLRGLA